MLTRLIIIRLFSNICKLAQVIPIFKNDSRLLCTNYRPISLLSNISKIFEKVIHSRLNLFLEQNNHIYSYQFGFRIDYSTNNVLMTIVEEYKSSLMLEIILLEYLVTLKRLSIQQTVISYLKSLIIMVLEVLQKIGFVLTSTIENSMSH